MKESKRRRSLSGAVLIMILTIMVVLIIILMTTLTVVTTANQRIYTKFEENQAYYTARSALDVYIQNMFNDKNYIAVVDSGSKKSYIHDDTSDDMTQGLALQLDLYSITAQSGDNISQKDLYTYASALPATNKKDEYKNYFGIKPGTSPSTDGPEINELYYQVVFPQVSGSGDSYGKMSDFADLDGDGVIDYGKGTATIKVEVVERVYSLGGVAIPDEDREAFFAKASTSPSGASYTSANPAQAVVSGDRQKDKMKVKITATTYFEGVEGTAVVYVNTNEMPKVNSSRAITSMGGIGSSIGMFAYGGSSAMSSMETNNNATLTDDLYVGGNFTVSSNTGALYFTNDTTYLIRGNLNYTHGSTYNTKFIFKNPGSVIYIEGAMKFDKDGSFGESYAPANLFANNINITGLAAINQMEYNGNFFCNELNIEDVSNAAVVNGNIYTNYVNLTNYDAGSGLYSNKYSVSVNWGDTPPTIHLDGFLDKWPSVKVGKGFYIANTDGSLGVYEFLTSNTLKVPTNEPNNGATPTLTLDCPTSHNHKLSDELKIDYTDPADFGGTLTPDFKKKFTLPSGVTLNIPGSSKDYIELPTQKSLYSEILKPQAFVDDPTDGSMGDIIPLPTVTITVDDVLAMIGTTTVWVNGENTAPVNQGNVAAILDGTLNADNRGSWGYNPWWDMDWEVDYQWTMAAKADAEAYAREHDPVYQQALANFNAAYITGQDKSGASNANLVEVTNEVEVKSIDFSSLDIVNDPDDALLSAAASAVGATRVIDSSGYIRKASASNDGTGNYTPYGTASEADVPVLTDPVIIDATGGPLTLQLGDGTSGNGDIFCGAFIVIGDNPVKLYLPNGVSQYNLGNSDGRVFYMCTYDIYKDTSTGNKTIKLGNTANATLPPKVFMYAGDNVTTVSLNHKSCALTAHIYMPHTVFAGNNSHGIRCSKMMYDGYEVEATAKASGLTDYTSGQTDVGLVVIGSLICSEYTTSSSGIGVAYIDPGDNSYKHGEPLFTMQAYQYARY